jgi:hypothetical protein
MSRSAGWAGEGFYYLYVSLFFSSQSIILVFLVNLAILEMCRCQNQTQNILPQAALGLLGFSRQMYLSRDLEISRIWDPETFERLF